MSSKKQGPSLSKKKTGFDWQSLGIEAALEKLGSSINGLSDNEAENRLQSYGRNQFTKKPPKKLIKMIWEHMTDAMALILIAAAIISIILNEWTEAIVVMAIVVVDMVIGVVQEKKATDAINSLKSMTAPSARALREGEESTVPAAELVPGDIVVLEQGMIVPADMRLITSNNLKVQEAALTGESVPVEKEADDIIESGVPIGDRVNMVFSSTIVTYGTALGVVVETGMDSEVGKIARTLDDQDDTDTPLKQKLNRVGKVLSIVGLAVAAAIFVIGFAYGRPVIPMLMIAISLAISVIPEGLPATATIVMALGVQRMVKRNALVRSLPAVETLGSATIICTDKTGTLTKNQMTVTEVAMSSDFQNERSIKVKNLESSHPVIFRELVSAAALCNNATEDPDNEGEFLGDPTESALIVLSESFGIDQVEFEKAHPRVFEQSFDSQRKRMTTINKMDKKNIAWTKGAVDEMLPLCSKILTESGVREMTDDDRKQILSLSDEMSQRALRLLGFAMRNISKVPEDDEADVEKDMTFLGITGMIDPPRKEVVGAVKTCHDAGIRVIMITGDHKTTAMTIAKQLNIFSDGDIAVSGDELSEMSDKELDKIIDTTTVFARVSPHDKLRIVESLQRQKEVVAMTGDGVNDSPALKAANIGVAMGKTGTDVAKDVSDLILLDDNFTTIEYAIREGRRVYRNIQKVIQFLLAGNIAEVATLFVATLFNWDPPILAVHILLINLVTDTLPALALGVDPPSKSIMKEKPIKGGSLFDRGLVGRVVSHGIFIFVITFGVYIFGLATAGYEVAMTMAFSVLALSQLVHAFNQRSNVDSVFTKGQEVNKHLFLANGASLVILIAVLFIPTIQDFFSLTWLNGFQWTIVVIVSILPLIFVELLKFFSRAKLASR